MKVSIFNEDIACDYVDRQVLQAKDVAIIFNCSASTAVRYLKIAHKLKDERGILTYHSHIVPANIAFEAWHIDIDRLRALKRKKEKRAS